jgi:molecular chaperone GrpE
MGRDKDDEEKPGRSGPRAANDQVPEQAGAAPAETAAGDAGAPAAPAPPDPAAEAVARAEKAEQAVVEIKDRMLRIAADFDNFKKRSRKEMAESEGKGREALLKELLPVIDNLERALAHASAADAAPGGSGLLEGVSLVHRQFLAALEKFDVKPFSAVGEAFDPAFHAAVAQVPSDKPTGMVVEEFQRGYKMGARLLRPAMVAVATGPRAPAAGSDGEHAKGGDDKASGETPPDAE